MQIKMKQQMLENWLREMYDQSLDLNFLPYQLTFICLISFGP